jgi:hypothetical protein
MLVWPELDINISKFVHHYLIFLTSPGLGIVSCSPGFTRIGNLLSIEYYFFWVFCSFFSWLRQNWAVISWVLCRVSCFSFPGSARIGYRLLFSWLHQNWALFPCSPSFAGIGYLFPVLLVSPELGFITLFSWLRQDWALVPCCPGFARIGH